MKILTDQCVFGSTITLLRDKKFSVITLKDLNEQTAEDEKVINLAQNINAILITNDMHFSNILVYPPNKYGGIIVLRANANTIGDVNKNLLCFLESHAQDFFTGKLVVINNKTCRVRTGN